MPGFWRRDLGECLQDLVLAILLLADLHELAPVDAQRLGLARRAPDLEGGFGQPLRLGQVAASIARSACCIAHHHFR